MSESLWDDQMTPPSEFHRGTKAKSDDFRDHPNGDNNDSADADSISYNSSEDDDSNGAEEYFNDDEDDEDNAALSFEELMYSANSYHAIARPVTVTMVLAALAAVYLNTAESLQAGAEQFAYAYNVWTIDDSGSGSTGMNLAMSIGNTLVMVTVIGTMTFGIVLLYKYRCMKCLIGYMVLSSASLLGLLGNELIAMGIEIYRIPIDAISYYLALYNFAVVGVISIFYQQGVPSGVTQGYLVCTSIILAWHLSHFDDWTAWTLLIMLALYDLCAVLTPCGPLKALVNLMQEEDSPEMPGLLYEAQLPAGTQKPGAAATAASSSSNRPSKNNEGNNNSRSSGDANENDDDANSESLPLAATAATTADTEPYSHSSSFTNTSISVPTEAESHLSPLNSTGTRIYLPLAIAKVYRLQLASTYGTSSSLKKKARSRRGKSSGPLLTSDGSEGSINDSPLLADSSPEEFYEQEFSPSQLLKEVEVELPRKSGTIERVPGRTRRELKFEVVRNNGDVRRELVVDKKGRVYDVTDADDDDSMYDEGPASIRLGLGDFIFYSVLVAKAAMYSFTTFAACLVVILFGLGATLVGLSVFHSALPALPISIFLGVIFYLLTRLVIEPWVEVVLTAPLYV